MAPCDYATPPAENLRLVAWLRAISDEAFARLVAVVTDPPRSPELAACTRCGKTGLPLDHGRCGRCGSAWEGR